MMRLRRERERCEGIPGAKIYAGEDEILKREKCGKLHSFVPNEV
jgi:hypothetical protein